jgi:hypothetical protein
MRRVAAIVKTEGSDFTPDATEKAAGLQESRRGAMMPMKMLKKERQAFEICPGSDVERVPEYSMTCLLDCSSVVGNLVPKYNLRCKGQVICLLIVNPYV